MSAAVGGVDRGHNRVNMVPEGNTIRRRRSVAKIDEHRRVDKDLNRTLTKLMETLG